MPRDPSLYNLYRRSLYSAANSNGEPTPHQNRTELFAVAALGFTLKHDAKFREFFLRNICGADASIDPSKCEIECQAADCSDLAIFIPEAAVFIIEAKIRAQLTDNQKPWNKRFETDGYGKQIRSTYKIYPKKHYIVLQNQSEPEMCDSRPASQQPIICFSRTWADLLDFGRNASGLVEDLFDSLAEFEIPAFKLRILGGKMKEHTLNTAKMYQLLAAVADKYGFDDRKAIDAGYSSDQGYFGLEILGPIDRFSQLNAAVGNQRKLGWFGFKSDSHGTNLSIRFYCGNGASEKAEDFIKKRGLSKNRDDEEAFCVMPEPDCNDDDFSWFFKVFDKLLDDDATEELRQMMDKTLWPDIAASFGNILGKASNQKKALLQLLDHKRYVIIAVFGDSWDFECLLGYFRPCEGDSNAWSVGVHLGGNPDSMAGNKATSAFRDFANKSKGSWKWQEGSDKEKWHWIEKTVDLNIYFTQKDRVKAIQDQFMKLLNEVRLFKDAYPELAWAQVR